MKTLVPLVVLLFAITASGLVLGQTIDFETLPDDTPTYEGQTISDQYNVPPFEVSFELVDSDTGQPLIPPEFPTIAEVGPPAAAFVGCRSPVDVCPEFDMPIPGQGVGERFLTSSTGADTWIVRGDLLITYTNPVAEASGVIIDVDRRPTGEWERFEITARTASGIVVDQRVILAQDGPTGSDCCSGNGPGDGIAEPWTLQSPTGTADIKTVRIRQTGTAGGVGLAFDLFSPSSIPCVDNDGDGYGYPGDPSCPNGNPDDCNDSDPCTYPGAPEVFDGADDDCDDLIDEDLDDDWDGVPNFNDVCPDTPPGGGVDPSGCGVCAGAIPKTLTMNKEAGADVTLAWDSSCMPGDADYAVYGGTLGDFASHAPVGSPVCTTAGATLATITPGDGNRFFVVVPQTEVREGSHGIDSGNNQRSQGTSPCQEQLVAPCGQ